MKSCTSFFMKVEARLRSQIDGGVNCFQLCIDLRYLPSTNCHDPGQDNHLLFK